MTAIGSSTARARALLARYVAECPWFWQDNTDKRQCEKLWRHLDAVEQAFGLHVEAALDQLVALAASRLPERPSTVYISGRGGSGSHWLAEMLGDLGPFADAGEVSVPSRLTRELEAWPLEEQGLVVDSLHLLHAWAGRPHVESQPKPHPDIATLHVVNSNGDSPMLRAKLWEPGCVFIHLIRDPRDQVLSFTYRKPTAHDNYPVEPLEDFLRLMLIYNRLSLSEVLMAPVIPDLVARYEDLRHGAHLVLRQIVALVGAEVPDQGIEEVAYRHSAQARREGKAPLGNLSRTPSKDWRTSATMKEKLLMHAGLAEVVDTLGYDLDDCQGQPLEFIPIGSDFELSLPEGVALGELHVRRSADGGWERAGRAAGKLTLNAGTMVRLRCAGAWTAGLERVGDLMPQGCLSSVCLAGNVDVRDADLACLSGLPGLLELDLARTRVTDACLDVIERMLDLRHLSVVGTAVSPAAVERLRAALPRCDVSAAPLVTDSLRHRRLFDEALITEPPQ